MNIHWTPIREFQHGGIIEKEQSYKSGDLGSNYGSHITIVYIVADPFTSLTHLMLILQKKRKNTSALTFSFDTWNN